MEAFDIVLLAVAGIIGGYAGARPARRDSEQLLRAIVGVSPSVYCFWN